MGKEFVQHLSEIALAVGIVSMEIGTRLLKAFEKLCEYLDPTVNKVTQNMLDSLNEAAEVTRDFILGITEHFNSLMDNGLETFFMNFADTFHKAITACAKVWTEFIKALDGLLDHLDPINNEFTKVLLGNISNAIIAVGDAFLAFAELVKNARENGLQDFINAIGDVILAIMNLAARITEISANALSGLFEHLNPETNPAAKGCIDAFTELANSIRDALGAIGDALQLAYDNGLGDFIKNIADCVLILADFAATLTGDLISAVTTFMNSWAGQAIIEAAAKILEFLSFVLEKLLELLNGPLLPLVEGLIVGFAGFKVLSSIAGWIGPVVSGISSFISVISSLAGTVSSVVGGISTFVSTLTGGGGLAAALGAVSNPVGLAIAAIAGLVAIFVVLYNKCEGFREVIDNIIAGFQGLVDAIKNHVEPVFNEIKEIFGNVMDIISGIFEGDGAKVGEAVRNLLLNIQDLMQELGKAFIDIGWNLILGLVNGIWECIKAIPKLLAGIGEFVIDFFKGLFGIHSPSTVFAEIGGYLIEGLIQGISDFTEVIDKLKEMATDIITEAGTKLKDAGKKCVEKLKEGMSSVISTVKEKGSEIVEGIKEGCSDGWEGLKDTGKTLGQKIKDGFCNILGINSPSKVMEEQGRYTVDGLVQGLSNSESSLAQMAESLGLSIDNNTLAGMKNLAANVIKSILDMSVQAGANMTKVVTNIVNSFDGISEKIASKFKNLQTSISSIFTKISTTVRKMVTGLKDAFKFEWKLPNIKTPKITWTTKESKLGFKYPSFSINH